MRHQKAGRKFGRNTSHRRAMFRNLAGNLVMHERIETTEAKAKELRRIVERLISKATRLGDDLTVDLAKLKDKDRERVVAERLHAQRLVGSFLPRNLIKTLNADEGEQVDTVHKLFSDIAPRYMKRIKEGKGGGYTRIIKLGNRLGDNAPLVLLELVDSPVVAKAEKSEGKGKGKKAVAKGEKAEAKSEKSSKKSADKPAKKGKKAAASDEE